MAQNASHSEEVFAEPRRFKCDTCQRRFNRREHLQRHESTHYNHKPFHCTLCRYSCRRRDLLNRHIRLAHPKKSAEDAGQFQSPEDLPVLGHERQSSISQYNAYGSTGDSDQVPQGPVHAICTPSVLDQSQEIPQPQSYTGGAAHQSVAALPLNATVPFINAEPSPRAVGFSYLDNVCLPPLYDQAAFYPGLSMSDSFLFPMFDTDPFNSDQPGMNAPLMRGISQVCSESAMPASESERQNYNFASFVRVSQGNWQWLSMQVAQFSNVLPKDYLLPSRHAISRYLHGFMNSFHPHFPIIHPQTLVFKEMAPELIIALAAVGSQYCLESHQGSRLFLIAKAIALEQLRRRDFDKDTKLYPPPDESWTSIQSPNSLPDSTQRERDNLTVEETLIDSQGDYAEVETMQAFFFLMAMATWAGEHRSLVRQAVATQSVLAMLVRQHGLSESPVVPVTWEEWARAESARRTKLIIFCFFNLHTIAFNLPSPLMVADMQLRIPCSELEWKCLDPVSWQKVNQQSAPQPLFQDCITALIQPSDVTPVFSSLGGHVLIHALLQRIISIQHSIRLQNLENEMVPGLSVTLQQALRKWQNGWEQNPESSYSPLDKYGPIAFNSRALYHLAHIRLAMDIGSACSLLEQSATQIAKKLYEGPKLERNPHLLIAARHATAALCSPVQMGVHFVSRAPSWSVMHAVCSLEYAYTLNQFLQAINISEFPLEEEEQALLATIKETLCEVETSIPSGNPKFIDSDLRVLGAKVVRAWAMILDGMRTWNAVCLITRTLFIYADRLEHDVFGNSPRK